MSKLVLVVDDEPHVCLLISRALKKPGIDVVTANGGAEAIQQIRSQFPDVLVTDLNMPEIDGRMLVDMIETKFGQKVSLVMLMTARTNKDIKAWAQKRGNMEFLEKPISPRKLVERIESHLFSSPE